MELDNKVVAEFLAAILQGSDAVDHDLLDKLDPGFFLNEDQGGVDSYKWLAELLRSREWVPFPFDFLDQELLVVKDTDLRTKYRNQLYALYQRDLTFVVDASKKFRSFVAYCIVNATVKSSLDAYERTGRIDYLVKDIQDSTFQAEDAIYGNERLVAVDYVGTFKDRMRRRLDRRRNPNLNPRILTGIPELDSQFKIRAPMVVNFLAPMKRYKSIVLGNLAFAAFLQGFNVMHLTFENPEEMTSDRADATFSLVSHDRVSEGILLKEELERMSKMFGWMDGWENRFKVVEAARNDTTVQDISKLLERMLHRDKFHPHIIILDYFNLVEPGRRSKEDHFSQEEVIWDLKKLARDYHCPIIGASQANREGLEAERLKFKHQGRSLSFLQAVDLSIAIDQTDEEKRDGMVILTPQVSRHDVIKTTEIILDSDLPRMLVSKSLPDMWEHARRVNWENN